MQEIDAGQRGYLLTGQERHLENFFAARDAIDPYYERLAEILAPYPQARADGASARAIDHKVDTANRPSSCAARAIRQKPSPSSRGARPRHAGGGARLPRHHHRRCRRSADRRRRGSAPDGEPVAAGHADRRHHRHRGHGRLGVDGAQLHPRPGGRARGGRGAQRRPRGRVSERTEELVRANEEIQRFAYIVTHDLRAPLVNIMGFTSELDETMQSIQKYVLAEGGTLEEHEIHEARQAASEDLPEAIGFIRSSTKKMDA
jgi:hypothetical protein